MRVVRNRGVRQYLAAGVRTDLEQLMANFSALSTVRYDDFAKLWKEKKMSFIFCGRESEMELREFTEECLWIAAEFLMPPYTFQVQVGAIYLLYGLYFKQPNNPRVRIRLTLVMWQHVQEFIQDLHSQQHLDVEFIFLKLQHTHAFDFVASPTQILPTNIQNTRVGDRDHVEEQRQHLLNFQRTELADVLNLSEMADIHLKYQQMKMSIAPTGSDKPSSSLSVIDEEIIDNITGTIYKHERWRNEKITGGQSPEKLEAELDKPEPDSVGARRALLKQRAYESAAPEGWRARRRAQPQPLIDDSESSPSKQSRLQANPEAADSPQEEEMIIIENEASPGRQRGAGRPKRGRGRGRGRGKKH